MSMENKAPTNSGDTGDYETYEQWLASGGIPFPLVFHYCPNCGKILSEVKTRFWSQDHSYSTGYKLESRCVFCSYSDIYIDVE